MPPEKHLPLQRILDYRIQTYRYSERLRLRTVNQAVTYANERGFLFFWPNKGLELPSLWGAVAGDRPVPNEHDDPAHVTWGWKDDLLGKKRWYYGRILHQRNTIISLDLLPNFYALSPNYGTPDEDYLLEYEQGKLTQEEKAVFETLLDQGPLNTLALRKAAHLSTSENTSRFNRALNSLQRDFRILPVGTAEAGAWHYAYVFDVVHRIYPELIELAYPIKKSQACRTILESYFLSVGAAQTRDMQKILRWPRIDLTHTLERLQESGLIESGCQLENQSGEWYVLKELLS
ncbi:AlkZ-related protein [Pelolinea submarina]|uniref:Winged helix DNA-binding protein n=1 Tax=Pelolinea submarina TaxID=913107 RepID=A0A347ZTY9_9CHLR|nr:crosslink repair DNA glycosylase YcaQ family protein [Pelolinea submarina]REG10646.1 winged helix DNA-binding protein [Pelolinea submarina]BBB48770.1 hypothetical protein Pelsub_P2001 [Pelolinea submarina]